jgi:hypothetical protein
LSEVCIKLKTYRKGKPVDQSNKNSLVSHTIIIVMFGILVCLMLGAIFLLSAPENSISELKVSELNWIFYMPILSIFGPFSAFLIMTLLFKVSRNNKYSKSTLSERWFRIVLTILSSAYPILTYLLLLLKSLVTGEMNASFKDIALGMGLTVSLWSIGIYAGATLAAYIFGRKKESQ